MNFYRSGRPGYTGRRRSAAPALSALFFPGVVLYHELLLRLFDRDVSFFGLALLRILLFSAAAGLTVFLLLDLLPWRRAARIIGGVLVGLEAVVLCVERGCRATFGIYYNAAFMGKMAGDVTGDFGSTVWSVALGLVPFILLALAVPLAGYILLCRYILADEGREVPVRIIVAAVLVACQLTASLLSTLGDVKNCYTYDFTANTAIPHFGFVTALRLELKYAVTGVPAPPLDDFLDDPIPSPTPEASAQPSARPSRPAATGPNVLDIDFQALADAEPGDTDESKTLKNMHQFFANVIPSEKNQYTGMFQDKNLILITAEAFCTYAIDQELTPTLYKLTHEGFLFSNFYQPDWTLSTTGGEFSVTTGVIPNWIDGSGSPIVSAENHMPTTLARLFAAQGYSVPAWHNHTYTYYQRNAYLENFGYDYKAKDNGMELAHPNLWPESDLEMMEATCDSYIDTYVNAGTRFHAYYMTVSGHGLYTWADNQMSAKHRAEVEAKYPEMSEPCQAYLACNMELDLALKHLVDKLEAAGIADDTLIVMTGDHYPYLIDKTGDYYNELRGFEDTENFTSRYRNTLLMWSGAIDEPIPVDTPCSSIDIVPTLCNLFGLEYDSRLYSGRDVFAENYQPDQYSNCMPLVVFANNKSQGNSWITAAGTYEAATKTFTPNEGVQLEDEEAYVKRVHRLVAAKVNYSKLIVQEDYYSYVLPD